LRSSSSPKKCRRPPPTFPSSTHVAGIDGDQVLDSGSREERFRIR
jgi:hypothetical protein